MAAPPAVLVNALDTLIDATSVDMLGAFPVGPSFGDDVLPVEPVEAMRTGRAHPVPLIVGTNADEARLFTRFLKVLPTTEHKIEALLAGAGAATRDRIIEAYPDYPAPKACLHIGGDFAFTSAAWQMADARSATTPTYVYRYDYAPRPLRWSGLGATHATELFAVFDIYQTRLGSVLTAAGDRKSAQQVSRDVQSRWQEFSRTGVPGAGLARLLGGRPCGDGVRPALAHRIRPARPPAQRLGRLHADPLTAHH